MTSSTPSAPAGYSALAIANYFVNLAQAESIKDMTPAKLHGLVYCAHGWLLAAASQPLVHGAAMADRDGIFLTELKDAGCWGTKNVSQPVTVVRLNPARGVMEELTPLLPPKDAVVPALQWVWKTYGKLSSFQVTKHLKETGGPWDLIWNDEARADENPKEIPNTTIKLWFRELSGKREAQAGHHVKMTDTQRSERRPKLDSTQRLLARTDPHKIRRT
jgi:uncharacterized phage-associated protein